MWFPPRPQRCRIASPSLLKAADDHAPVMVLGSGRTLVPTRRCSADLPIQDWIRFSGLNPRICLRPSEATEEPMVREDEDRLDSIHSHLLTAPTRARTSERLEISALASVHVIDDDKSTRE